MHDERNYYFYLIDKGMFRAVCYLAQTYMNKLLKVIVIMRRICLLRNTTPSYWLHVYVLQMLNVCIKTVSLIPLCPKMACYCMFLRNISNPDGLPYSLLT